MSPDQALMPISGPCCLCPCAGIGPWDPMLFLPRSPCWRWGLGPVIPSFACQDCDSVSPVQPLLGSANWDWGFRVPHHLCPAPHAEIELWGPKLPPPSHTCKGWGPCVAFNWPCVWESNSRACASSTGLHLLGLGQGVLCRLYLVPCSRSGLCHPACQIYHAGPVGNPTG